MLTSCGGGTTAETTSADTEAPVQTEAETVDPLAGIDYEGKTLRISSSIDTNDSTNAHALIAGSGEMTGEIVNDAVYQRNLTVTELLNIVHDFPNSFVIMSQVSRVVGNFKKLDSRGNEQKPMIDEIEV